MKIEFSAFKNSYGRYIAEALIFEGEHEERLVAEAETRAGLDLECMTTVGAFFAEREDIIESVDVKFNSVDNKKHWSLAEYEDAVGYYEKIRDEASKKIAEIREAYLAVAPFKAGDKVRVTHQVAERIGEVVGLKIITTEAFVCSVVPGNGVRKYEYSFFEVKKDGTQSSRRLYISRIRKIEKV